MTDRKAKCHPERKHHARGKCNTCYQREYKRKYVKKNPDYRKKQTLKQRQYVRDNKERLLKVGKWHSRYSRYGITKEKYVEIYNIQGKCCAICGKKAKKRYSLAIDHCHVHGHVRGLLCRRCNTGLGQLRDDVRVMKRAIRYLLMELPSQLEWKDE